MTVSQHIVGMSDLVVAKGPAIYTCLGLGSCIGFCALDPRADISAMIHIMLPESFPDKPVDKLGKFANTALPAMLEKMLKMGADRSRIVTAYAGGAQVFRFGAAADSRLDVGNRNGIAVQGLTRALSLRVVASDTGGSNGRTVVFDSASGVIKVRSVATGERELGRLR